MLSTSLFLLLLTFTLQNPLPWKGMKQAINAKYFNVEPWDIFDYYVFSIQFASTVCQMGPLECEEKMSQIQPLTMTIRGLWIGAKSGKDLDTCNPDTIDVVDDGSKLWQDMHKYMPGLLVENDTDFWTDEYNEYGYCYMRKNRLDGNNYKIWFQKVLDLFESRNYADIVIDIVGFFSTETSMPFEEFQREVGMRIGMDCTQITCSKQFNKYYLRQIRVGLDLDLNPWPGSIEGTDCDAKGDIYFEPWV